MANYLKNVEPCVRQNRKVFAKLVEEDGADNKELSKAGKKIIQQYTDRMLTSPPFLPFLPPFLLSSLLYLPPFLTILDTWHFIRINILLALDQIRDASDTHAFAQYVAKLDHAIRWQTPKWKGIVWRAVLYSGFELFMMACKGRLALGSLLPLNVPPTVPFVRPLVPFVPPRPPVESLLFLPSLLLFLSAFLVLSSS
jgi:hypothetical protein